MTEILVLLCLTVAGLEIYIALHRNRRPDVNAGRISELEAARAALEDRLARVEHPALEAEVAELREQLRHLTERIEHDLAPVLDRMHAAVQDRLDQEMTETLGGQVTDSGVLAGGLSAGAPALGDEDLSRCYDALLQQYGLRVKFEVSEVGGTRYYLASAAGRGPVELEWDLIALLNRMRGRGLPEAPTAERRALESLLAAVKRLEKGFVQLGPLVVVRTPDALLAGVLSVSESRAFDTAGMLGDLTAAAATLQRLPGNRFHDLTDYHN